MNQSEELFKFKLNGKTLVIIDWANVYGWFKKLKWEIDPKKLFDYLKTYQEIYNIRFYFGVETDNRKSENFQNQIKKIGYNLISKEVKWIPVYLEDQNHLKKILNIIHKSLDNIDSMLYKDIGVMFETNFLREILQYPFYRRKCDFDVEISRDIYNNLDNFETIIIFSGDGDYAALVEDIISKKKKTILVFAPGHKGREYEDFEKGLFLCSVKKLKEFIVK